MNGNLTPAEEAIRAIDPWRRADQVRDMIDGAVYIATHLGVRVPARIVAELDVIGDGPAEREYDVLLTAIALGVTAERDGDGCLCASRQFGTLTIEARTPPRKAA